MTIDLIAKGGLSLLLAAAATYDVLTLRIPDRLTLLIVAAFVAFAAAQGLSPGVLLQHAASGALLFSIALTLAVLGQLGGGDVKLLGAIGLWMGFGPSLLLFTFDAAIWSLVLVGIVVGLRIVRLPLPVFILAIDWVDEAVRGSGPLRKLQAPYGVPLAVAAIAAIWTI